MRPRCPRIGDRSTQIIRFIWNLHPAASSSELAPDFAPNHVANIKILAREKYWDGLAITRVDDNYVVQWADPNADQPDRKRRIRYAKETLPAELDCAIGSKLPFTALPDKDVYASSVGFTNGFPVARDDEEGRTWLVHSYGAVGAGRDTNIDSGGGRELTAVIGHAPRQLDRNVTLVGRVRQGMEFLSSLPRGNEHLGFHQDAAPNLLITSVRIASDVRDEERTHLEVLRTDTPLFSKLVEARRNRREEWFHTVAGAIDIANVPLPVRPLT